MARPLLVVGGVVGLVLMAVGALGVIVMIGAASGCMGRCDDRYSGLFVAALVVGALLFVGCIAAGIIARMRARGRS